MTPKTFAEQLFFVTAHLEGRNETRHWTGTGFIHRVPLSDGRSLLVVVTNRHVIEGADSLKVRLIRATQQATPDLAHAVEVAVDSSKSMTDFATFHPDQLVDVAVIPLAPVVAEMSRLGATTFFKAVGTNLMPTPAEIENFDAIEQVMFVGYPAGIFDIANNTPVVRQGTAATPLQLDYGGRPAFLIDASVFPGSSGSPVFLTPGAFSVARSGGFNLGGRRPVLLGVLAAVHALQVTGEIHDTVASLVPTFQQPINLGIVFKSRAIDETVDVLLATAGLTRDQTVTEAA